MATLDVEDENILATIFKDSFPANWQDNADFAEYLAQLSSFGLDKLSREPDRLAEERSQILEQTQELAFDNYKTFIQTAECSRDIYEDFQIIEKHVGDMLDKLPQFAEECGHFMKSAQDISSSRKTNTLTLQRHTQLLEILEIPQLMDTCVRNGYYDEALELSAHVKRIEKKHSAIAVVQGIVSEVRRSCQLMLNQLLQQLRTNLQLPACLRVIGYLRRMDVFTEVQLRIKFLQARDTWFQGILSAIPSNDAYTHITKTIETSRVHLFDIITQYRAIFSDEDPLLTTVKEDAPIEGALFHGWVVHKVSQFLTTLEHDLEQGVGGRLDSVLGQCMYFGLSFSRVGADFRGLLAPVFQRSALKLFEASIKEATVKFEEAMMTFTLLSQPALHGSTPSAYSLNNSATLQPPLSLLDFPPLAVYCNGVLTAFNDLRLCSPISLADNIANQLQESVVNVASTILSFHRTEEGAFNQHEQELFTRLCSVFADDFLPFVNRCLQALFPPMQIAQILGVSLSELAKMGNIGIIDCTVALKPLEHLLPAKKEEVSELPIGKQPVFTLDTDSTDESEQPLHKESPPSAENEDVSIQADKDGPEINAASKQSNSSIESHDKLTKTADVSVMDGDCIVHTPQLVTAETTVPNADSEVSGGVRNTVDSQIQLVGNTDDASKSQIVSGSMVDINFADMGSEQGTLDSNSIKKSDATNSQASTTVTSSQVHQTSQQGVLGSAASPSGSQMFQIPPEIQRLLDQTNDTSPTEGAT